MCDIRGQFGCGLFHVGPDDAVCFGHLGGIDGYVSLFTWLPEEKLAVAMCSNGLNLIQETVLDAILMAVHGGELTIPDFNYVLLSPEEIAPYTGSFACPEIGLAADVIAGGNHLFIQVPGQQRILLDTRRAGLFECSRGGMEIEFPDGYDLFVLRQGGGEFRMSRCGKK